MNRSYLYHTRPGPRTTEGVGRRHLGQAPTGSTSREPLPISPSRHGLQFAYGRFLAFLSAYQISLLDRAPAERIDRKIVEAYVKRQPASCGSISIATYLSNLQQALRYLCPDEDWSWLRTIVKRISAHAKPKPERNHLATSEPLYTIGINLMDRAISNCTTAKCPSGELLNHMNQL
jgi:hypothetical protein